jgi:hypothetical protein
VSPYLKKEHYLYQFFLKCYSDSKSLSSKKLFFFLNFCYHC